MKKKFKILAASLIGVASFGQVGIGTATPVTELDVRNLTTGAGAIGLGTTLITASAAKAGALRYNGTDSAIDYSNGTTWVRLAQEQTSNEYRLINTGIGGFVAIQNPVIAGVTKILDGSTVTVTVPTGYATRSIVIRFDLWGDINFSTVASGSLRYGIAQTINGVTTNINSVMMNGWSAANASSIFTRFSAPVAYTLNNPAPGTYTFKVFVSRESEAGTIGPINVWGGQSFAQVFGKKV